MNTLAEYIVIPRLEFFTSKGFFGGKKIWYSDYLQICAFAYESGALLAQVLGKHSDLLEQLIGSSLSEDSELRGNCRSRLNSLISPAREVMEGVVDATFVPVNSFGWLVVKSELSKKPFKKSFLLTTKSYLDYFDTNDLDYSDFTSAGSDEGKLALANEVRKLLYRKVRVNAKLIEGAISISAEGFAFGIEYPERTDKMYQNTYGGVSPEEWKRLHGAALFFGIVTPDPDLYPLVTRMNDLTSLVKEYADEYRPDLKGRVSVI